VCHIFLAHTYPSAPQGKRSPLELYLSPFVRWTARQNAHDKKRKYPLAPFNGECLLSIICMSVGSSIITRYSSYLLAVLKRLLSASVGVRPSEHSSYSLTWYRVKKGEERVLLTPDLCKYMSPLICVSDASEAIVALAFAFCIEKVYLERAIEARGRHPELVASWTGQLAERVSGGR
jgi:hypothetical protein